MKTTSSCLIPLLPPKRALLVWLPGVLLVLGFFVLVSFTSRVAAQGLVPERFAFQGYMEDGNGQPLGATTPTNQTLVFRIFPTATGPGAVWAERQVVTFDKGNYSVIFGQGSQNLPEPHGDLSAVVTTATSSELYVQTSLILNGNDVPILPRLRLLPAMYSYVAKKALSVDGAAITSGSVTEDRLSPSLASTINNGPIADSRLTSGLRNYITNGPVADSRLSSTLLDTINNGQIADNRLTPGLRTYITNGAAGPVADSRLSVNVPLRNAPNTFTGNQTIQGNVGIGTATPAAPLDVNGELKIRSEKPIAFKLFSGTGSGGAGAAINMDTGWPTNRYFVSVAGFLADKGDFFESGMDAPMVMVRVVASPTPPYNWRIEADTRNHGSVAVQWKVMAMRVVRELVTDDSWDYARW